jgi:hypothetical protein
MGFPHVHPNLQGSGTVLIESRERTSGVIFKAADATKLDALTNPPIAVIEKAKQRLFCLCVQLMRNHAE